MWVPLAIVELIAVAMVAAGTGAYAMPAAARPLDDVVADGHIAIAVYRDFPPFSYFDDQQRLVGVDVDIGRAIAAKLGVEARYMPVTSGETVDDDLRNAVWKGHYIERVVADLMLHVPFDRTLALRNSNVAMFAPYARIGYVLAHDPKRAPDGADLLALAPGGIGVEIASLPDYYLSSAFNGRLQNSLVHYRTIAEAADALEAGEVASVVGSRPEVEATLDGAANGYVLSPFTTAGFGMTSWLIGTAVKEDSRDLGYAVEDILAALIDDGTIEAIHAAHGLSYDPPRPR